MKLNNIINNKQKKKKKIYKFKTKINSKNKMLKK